MNKIMKRLIAFSSAFSLMIGSMSLQGLGILRDTDIPITVSAVAGAAEEFISNGYDTKGVNVYSTNSTDSFKMNGRTYYQGIEFSGKNRYSYASFNTENISSLSFSIGHLDDTQLYTATLTITLDDVEKDVIELSSLMNTEEYTLDVSSASSVRFYFDFDGYHDASYALADFTVDSAAPSVPCETPSYDSSEAFIKSGFNKSGVTACDGMVNTSAFNMNGRTYNQGIIFNGKNKYSYGQYNVENVESLDFTIGHVDGTEMYAGTLTIYLDGKEQDIIELSSLMNLQEYSLDVSDTSVVRFYFNFNAYRDNSYALANFSVDGKPVSKTYETPSYENSEMCLKSVFNTYGTSVYDGVATTRSFNMNGRTYYQGLVFNGNSKYSYAQLNVENVDTIDFTIGHVDNTELYGATLKITLDGEGEDEIELSSVKNPQEYTLDVSDASVVRFYFDFNGYRDNSYALANFSIDGQSVKKTDVVPEYANPEKFLKAGFNENRVVTYDGSSNAKSFNMDGRTYYQGLVFSAEDRYTYAQFNVENVDTLGFTIGHIDGTEMYDATFTIFLDGNGEDEIKLSPKMNLMEYTLDVSEASMVRFYFDCDKYNYHAYGLGDITVDGNPVKKEHEVPEYSTPEKLLKEGFNVQKATTYNGASKTDSFEMSGRTYYQGIVFSGDSKYAYEQFNVENVDSISFTVGHVDNTDLNNATMSIVCDNRVVDEVELKWNMPLRDYTIDVSDTDLLRIFIEFDGFRDISYGIGDISLNSVATVKPCVIPVYKNTAEWLTDKFDISNATIYDGTDKLKGFEIGGESYKEGIVLNTNNRYAYTKFNTENLNSISFKIGYIEGKNKGDSVFSVVADSKVVDEITLKADNDPIDYSLDVSDISAVRFYIDGKDYYSKDYAIYDISITSKDIIEPSVTTAAVMPVSTTTSAEKTTTEAVKTTATTTKQVATTEKATETTSKQTATTEKATVTTSKQTATTEKATVTTSKQTATTEKATVTTSKQTATTEKATNTTSKQTATTEKATNTTSKKIATTEKATVTTSEQTATTEKVTNTTTKQVATTTAAGSSSEIKTTVIGDINNDGKIDANDATLVLVNYSLLSTGEPIQLTESQQKAADVNEDGKIDASDATKILQYYSYLSTGGDLAFKEYMKQNG